MADNIFDPQMSFDPLNMGGGSAEPQIDYSRFIKETIAQKLSPTQMYLGDALARARKTAAGVSEYMPMFDSGITPSEIQQEESNNNRTAAMIQAGQMLWSRADELARDSVSKGESDSEFDKRMARLRGQYEQESGNIPQYREPRMPNINPIAAALSVIGAAGQPAGIASKILSAPFQGALGRHQQDIDTAQRQYQANVMGHNQRLDAIEHQIGWEGQKHAQDLQQANISAERAYRTGRDIIEDEVRNKGLEIQAGNHYIVAYNQAIDNGDPEAAKHFATLLGMSADGVAGAGARADEIRLLNNEKSAAAAARNRFLVYAGEQKLPAELAKMYADIALANKRSWKIDEDVKNMQERTALYGVQVRGNVAASMARVEIAKAKLANPLSNSEYIRTRTEARKANEKLLGETDKRIGELKKQISNSLKSWGVPDPAVAAELQKLQDYREELLADQADFADPTTYVQPQGQGGGYNGWTQDDVRSMRASGMSDEQIAARISQPKR